MPNIRAEDRASSRTAENAPYAGTYTRKGAVLTREDGLQLLTRSRSEVTDSTPGLFLLTRRGEGGKWVYLSSLYRNGREFEDRRSKQRYRINPGDGDTATVECIGVPTRFAVGT